MNAAFFDRKSELAANLNHAIARDAGQHRRRKRRRVHNAVADQKDVLARTFRNVAAIVERDAFCKTVDQRFHLDQLRIHVIRAALGHGGQGIRRQAIPARDANIDTLFDRFVTQVLAPIPRADVASQRVRKRIHAEGRMCFVKTAERNRTDVALLEAAAPHQFDRSIAKIIHVPSVIHAIDFGGIQETLHVFAQAKNRRPAFRRITTNAFENARPIMQNVRHHVHARVIPFDELAVVPHHVANARSCHVCCLATAWKHVLILLWRLNVKRDRKRVN